MVEELLDILFSNFQQALNGGPWAPKINSTFETVTFCNYFVDGVCEAFGYHKFWPDGQRFPLMANDIVDIMDTQEDWLLLADGSVAQARANEGCLVVAGLKHNEHGHVAIIRPGNCIESGHWGTLAPRVANVGEQVFLDRAANYAFQDKPNFFVLKSTIKDETVK